MSIKAINYHLRLKILFKYTMAITVLEEGFIVPSPSLCHYDTRRGRARCLQGSPETFSVVADHGLSKNHYQDSYIIIFSQTHAGYTDLRKV